MVLAILGRVIPSVVRKIVTSGIVSKGAGAIRSIFTKAPKPVYVVKTIDILREGTRKYATQLVQKPLRTLTKTVIGGYLVNKVIGNDDKPKEVKSPKAIDTRPSTGKNDTDRGRLPPKQPRPSVSYDNYKDDPIGTSTATTYNPSPQTTPDSKTTSRTRTKSRPRVRVKHRAKSRGKKPRFGTKAWMTYIRGMRGKKRKGRRRIVRGRGLGYGEINHSRKGMKVVSFKTKDGRVVRFKTKR